MLQTIERSRGVAEVLHHDELPRGVGKRGSRSCTCFGFLEGLVLTRFVRDRDDDGRSSRTRAAHDRQWANLTLKYDVSDVRLLIVSVFRMVAAGCVVHFEKAHSEWLVTREGTFWLPAMYAEKNADTDGFCTVRTENPSPPQIATIDQVQSGHAEYRVPDLPSHQNVTNRARVHVLSRD